MRNNDDIIDLVDDAIDETISCVRAQLADVMAGILRDEIEYAMKEGMSYHDDLEDYKEDIQEATFNELFNEIAKLWERSRI